MFLLCTFLLLDVNAIKKKGRILQSERKFVGFISYLVLAKLLLMHGVCVCMPQ